MFDEKSGQILTLSLVSDFGVVHMYLPPKNWSIFESICTKFWNSFLMKMYGNKSISRPIFISFPNRQQILKITQLM